MTRTPDDAMLVPPMIDTYCHALHVLLVAAGRITYGKSSGSSGPARRMTEPELCEAPERMLALDDCPTGYARLVCAKLLLLDFRDSVVAVLSWPVRVGLVAVRYCICTSCRFHIQNEVADYSYW